MRDISERAVEGVVAALKRLPIRDLEEPGGELDELRLREAARAVIHAHLTALAWESATAAIPDDEHPSSGA